MYLLARLLMISLYLVACSGIIFSFGEGIYKKISAWYMYVLEVATALNQHKTPANLGLLLVEFVYPLQ